MVDVHILGLAEVAVAVGLVAETGVTEGEHVEAMDAVHLVQTAVPHLQVGETDGKIVHHHFLVQVLFAVVHQTVEVRASLLLVAEGAESESCIENLVGLGVVVVHRGGRFGGAKRSLLEAFASHFFIALCLVTQSEQIVEVILLRAVQFPFAQMVWVLKTFIEKLDGFVISAFGDGEFGQFYAGRLILSRDLAFATLPGMELMVVKLLLGFLIFAALVQKRYFFQNEVVALFDQLGIVLQ